MSRLDKFIAYLGLTGLVVLFPAGVATIVLGALTDRTVAMAVGWAMLVEARLIWHKYAVHEGVLELFRKVVQQSGTVTE